MSSPFTLVRFEDQHPFIQESSSYTQLTAGQINLLVKGDIWGIAGKAFESLEKAKEALLPFYFTQPDRFWTNLQGDFSAILIDSNKIEAYRSSFSPHLLFFRENMLGDSLSELVKVTPHNPPFCADYLKYFVMDVPSLQFGLELTPLAGIKRLPPHSCLVLRHQSPSHLVRFPQRKFSVVEREIPIEDSGLELKNKTEEVLRWHLTKSGPLAAELSGGLDSSFVASFLSDLRPGAVQAHMYSYRKNPSHLFSENCAKEVAKEKHISLHVFDSDQAETLQLEDLKTYQNEPIDFYWQGALFGKMSQDFLSSQSLLFTGFGCDQLLMRNASILLYLRKKHGFLAGLRFVRSFAKASQRSFLNFSYQYLLSLLPFSLLVRLVDSTRTWKINPFKMDELISEAGRWERINWVKFQGKNLSGYDLFQTRHIGLDFQSQYFDSLVPQPNLNYLIAPQYVLGPYLAEKNIQYIHPFCDSRLIEFAFSQIPFHLIHDYQAPYKNLLRQSMSGIVPEKVRNRPQDEFSFDGYYYRFLQRNEGFLRELVEEALPEHAEWIDPELFRKSFESMLFGGYSQSEVAVSRFISYLVWKRQFMRFLEGS